jgi:hypothetical protein
MISAERSDIGAHSHADDSALREGDESRGTRFSERHSAQNDAGPIAALDESEHVTSWAECQSTSSCAQTSSKAACSGYPASM